MNYSDLERAYFQMRERNAGWRKARLVQYQLCKSFSQAVDLDAEDLSVLRPQENNTRISFLGLFTGKKIIFLQACKIVSQLVYKV